MPDLKDPDSYMPEAAAVIEIERAISDYNLARPAIYARCRRNAVIGMAVYGVFGVIVAFNAWKFLDDGDGMGWVLGLLLLGGMGLYTVIWQPMERHQQDLRADLFPKLFGFIDGIRYQKNGKPGFLQQVNALKLAPHSGADNDDLISGRHEGLQFELLETELTRGSGRSKETVFKGLIFHFRLDKPFAGTLVAARGGGWFERTMRDFWRTGPSNELKSGNLRLDESHQFFSDNFAAAKPIIAGPLTSVLIWLGNQWSEGDARIALSGDDGYLMLPSTHDYFSMPAMGDDVVYDRHVRPLVRELVMALAVAHVVRAIG